MSTGTDIVRVSRMESMKDKGFPKKVFTDYEREYIKTKNNACECAAGIFAAKEAVLKALGTGISMPLSEICVTHTRSGRPCVILEGSVLSFARSLGVSSVDISISHDGEYAVACAVCTEDKYTSYLGRAMSKLSDAPDNAIVPQRLSHLIPKRKEQTHKGDYGRLCVISGSKGLTGAAILSCRSAVRCGAGLVTLMCAQELNTIFECSLTEVMTKCVADKNGMISEEAIPHILNQISNSDVCLIGPGLGRSSDISSVVSAIIENSHIPCIIDADGLYALSKDIEVLSRRNCEIVITPHIGEFSALTGISTDQILLSPQKYASDFSKQYNVTTILKSHKTAVAFPDGNVFVNVLGNPGMATGGSGDVLAGCVASFAAQGLSLGDASLVGVYLHSLAGDIASYEKGEYSLIPSDIIEFLPYAIKSINI